MSEIPIPTLTPEAVRATGAYALAYSICALMFTAGFIISKIPPLSRSLRSEGRAVYTSSLISIALLTSLLSIDLILSLLQASIGIPDWSLVASKVSGMEELATTALDVVVASLTGYMAGMAILGIISYVFAPLQIVLLLVHNVFTHMGLFISAIGALALIVIILSGLVRVIISVASNSFFLVASGIALYPLKWTRGLGITLLVLGIALYYGIPLTLGFVQVPERSEVVGDEELAQSRLLSALNNESVPVNLEVRDMNGKPLPWSYVGLNSSVQFRAPPNSTLARNYGIGETRGEALVNYTFGYTRFYNGSYVYGYELDDLPALESVEGKLLDKTRTVFYRVSSVSKLWFLGLYLNYTPTTIRISGGVNMDNPDAGLKSLTSVKDYYDYIYSRAPTVEIRAPWVESLNRNSSAITLYNDEAYEYVKRVEEKTYRFDFTLLRTHYSCWVSRTENRTDPTTNQTYTVNYYSAKANYYGQSEEKLYIIYVDALSPNPKAIITSAVGGYKPSLHVTESSLADVKSKGLILGYGKLAISPAHRITDTFELGKEQAETAKQYLVPGRIVESGELAAHEVDPPQDLVLDPSPSVMAIWVGGTAERSSGEKEGSCPSLPKALTVAATLRLSADKTAAWDPLIRWEPLTKSGDIHAYKLYEQDPKHPRLEPTVSEDDEGGILGVMINEATKWSIALFLPFLVADSVSSVLGGYSVGGAIVGGVKKIAKGVFATRLFRGGAMRGATFSIGEPLRRAVAEEEKQLLKKLEYERFKAIKERDRLKVAYIVTALATYKRAKKPRILPKPELKRSWRFIRLSRDNEESRRARIEFYQAVSRIFPEEATLLQRLSDDKKVNITRTQAERVVEDYSRANKMSFLMASRDASSLGRAILRGNAEIDERVLRGYVRPASQASQYNIATASQIRGGVLGKIYDTTLPFGFSSIAKSTASKSLVNRAGFEIHQRYGSAKIVRGLSNELSDNDSAGLTETERIYSGYEHVADLKLTRNGLEGTIANNPGGEELGRTITIDTGNYEAPSVEVSNEEVRKAEADLIGFVRDFYQTKERESHPIGRHTGGRGHDWFWEVV